MAAWKSYWSFFQPCNSFFEVGYICFHLRNFFFQQLYVFPQDFIFFDKFFNYGIFILHALFLPQRI